MTYMEKLHNELSRGKMLRLMGNLRKMELGNKRTIRLEMCGEDGKQLWSTSEHNSCYEQVLAHAVYHSMYNPSLCLNKSRIDGKLINHTDAKAIKELAGVKPYETFMRCIHFIKQTETEELSLGVS